MASTPWDTDKDFVVALRRRNYIHADGALMMAPGTYLYLHELWNDGLGQAVREMLGPGSRLDVLDWQAVVDHWKAQGRDLRHLEVPSEFAALLGVPLEKARRRETAMEDSEDTEMSNVVVEELKWKRKREFDGTQCGYVGCTRPADGYVPGTRSTKGSKTLWYGPACIKCVRKWHPSLMPMTLTELARQRTGASDLAGLLDLEVGEILRRLEAVGADECGQPLSDAVAVPCVSEEVKPATPTHLRVEVETEVLTPQTREYTIAVIIPFDTISAVQNEMVQTLAVLPEFHITDQSQMDYASGYLQKVKGFANDLESRRKELSKPFRKQLEAVGVYFKPALNALSVVEIALKQKIQEGYRRAQQAQAAAFGQAEKALETGDLQRVALATQEAVAADVALSSGIQMRSRPRFEVIDPSQLPGAFWSPDMAKIQEAINAGYREIPGVRIWEEQSVAARSA